MIISSVSVRQRTCEYPFFSGLDKSINWLSRQSFNSRALAIQIQDDVSLKSTEVGIKRHTSHRPNRMLMRENKGFFSFAFDSAHVKYRVWPGSNPAMAYLSSGKQKRKQQCKLYNAIQTNKEEKQTVLFFWPLVSLVRTARKFLMVPRKSHTIFYTSFFFIFSVSVTRRTCEYRSFSYINRETGYLDKALTVKH